MKTYVIPFEGNSIKCLFCGRISYNLNDVLHKYCANCHVHHESEHWTDMGPCCACQGESGLIARNIVMLKKRGKHPGQGWGCLQCGLPNDGASSVVCDTCLEHKKPIRFVVDGYAAEKRRMSINDLDPERFDHDMTRHAQERALVCSNPECGALNSSFWPECNLCHSAR